MSDYLMIDEVAELTEISIRRLIQQGIAGHLSIYALGDWFWSTLKEPDKRYNVREPILMDDIEHLRRLARSETFQLHVDCNGRNICRRDCDDDEFFDGVTVEEINLYCLKSEIEELHRKASQVNLTSKSVIDDAGDQMALKEWKILESDAEGETILQAEIETERQQRNVKLRNGIDFERKSDTDSEPALIEAQQTEAVQINGADWKPVNLRNQLHNTGETKISQLHCLIWRVYQHLLKKPDKVTALKVWNEIQHRHQSYDEEEIIQEVTTNKIDWRSFYGNEQTLKRSSFAKTLSKLKANPPF